MVQAHVGIGGWTFAPWRGRFYPPGLPHAQELAYAAARLTAIEINATFYGRQKPESFARWAAAVPEGFVFALKASRFCTHRRALDEAGPSITNFLDSGITRLGPRLGPILWQFPATRAFEPAPFAAFLRLLPPAHDALPLRHVIEARHPSFADPAFMALLAAHGVAHAIIEEGEGPTLGDVTADFVYARLKRSAETEAEGYDAAALDGWAARVRGWLAGRPATDLPRAGPPESPRPRDVFVFFIAGDKVRAPDAARALLARLGQATAALPSAAELGESRRQAHKRGSA